MHGSTFSPRGTILLRIISNPKGMKNVATSQTLYFVSVWLFNSIYSEDF